MNPTDQIIKLLSDIRQGLTPPIPKQQQIRWNTHDVIQPKTVNVQGRFNQITVSIRQGKLWMYFNYPNLSSDSTQWPEPDFEFNGPTGNPIPIPFYGSRDITLTFVQAPNSAGNVAGSAYISFY